MFEFELWPKENLQKKKTVLFAKAYLLKQDLCILWQHHYIGPPEMTLIKAPLKTENEMWPIRPWCPDAQQQQQHCHRWPLNQHKPAGSLHQTCASHIRLCSPNINKCDCEKPLWCTINDEKKWENVCMWSEGCSSVRTKLRLPWLAENSEETVASAACWRHLLQIHSRL